MTESESSSARELAIAIHPAAVAGVDPRSVTHAAVASRIPSSSPPFWIIALGKAAGSMCEAALDALRAHNAEPAGGVVIAPERVASVHPALLFAAGDHPV